MELHHVLGAMSVHMCIKILCLLVASFHPPTVEKGILDVPMEQVHLLNASVHDALIYIRQKDVQRIVFGFERLPESEQDAVRFTLNLKRASLRESLDAIVRFDPRYSYEVIENKLIYVHPRSSPVSTSRLLQVRIARFELTGRQSVSDAILKMPHNLPEVRNYLKPSGVPVGSTDGAAADMHGNMDPEIKFSAANLTVRELLNRLALYSIAFSRKSGEDRTGWRVPPVSWSFKLKSDASASNRLGGFPEFEAF